MRSGALGTLTKRVQSAGGGGALVRWLAAAPAPAAAAPRGPGARAIDPTATRGFVRSVSAPFQKRSLPVAYGLVCASRK